MVMSKYTEKNERRRKYRDTSARGQAARKMRREYGGMFGDATVHPYNYNLMVTGTSKDGDVRHDKEGRWA